MQVPSPPPVSKHDSVNRPSQSWRAVDVFRPSPPLTGAGVGDPVYPSPPVLASRRRHSSRGEGKGVEPRALGARENRCESCHRDQFFQGASVPIPRVRLAFAAKRLIGIRRETPRTERSEVSPVTATNFKVTDRKPRSLDPGLITLATRSITGACFQFRPEPERRCPGKRTVNPSS